MGYVTKTRIKGVDYDYADLFARSKASTHDYEIGKIKQEYAKQTGYYEGLGAGSASRIRGDVDANAEFMSRNSGGNGLATILSMRGKSLVWNQLYVSAAPSAQTGHLYMLIETASSTTTKRISDTISYTSGSTNRVCIDLTLMYGEGEEPASVSEFTKFFPLDYYSPCSPRLLNFCATSLKSTTGGTGVEHITETLVLDIPTLKGTKEGSSTSELIFPDGMKSYGEYYDEIIKDGNNWVAYKRIGSLGTTTFLLDEEIVYTIDSFSGNYNADILGTEEIEPNNSILAALPEITSVTGKINGVGSSSVIFPSGLLTLSTTGAFDEIGFSSARKRVASLFLASLNFTYDFDPEHDISYDPDESATSYFSFVAQLPFDAKANAPAQAVCSAYPSVSQINKAADGITIVTDNEDSYVVITDATLGNNSGESGPGDDWEEIKGVFLEQIEDVLMKYEYRYELLYLLDTIEGTAMAEMSIEYENSMLASLRAETGLFNCLTAGNYIAKVVDARSYELSLGGSMKIRFLHKLTANSATLNINSQGAKTLYYNGIPATKNNTWNDNEILNVFYDGTNYQAYSTNVLNAITQEEFNEIFD